MDRELSYRVHTFGCKVNTYDGGLLQKQLDGHGFSGTNGEPRIHVLNTCAVTAEATKESVKMIRRLKSKDPFCTVVVTGCAAQVDTGSFENLKGADLVVANSHKGQISALLKQHFAGTLKNRIFKSNIFKKEDLEAGGGVEENHTRSFLKIQDGCNSFCTYCVIPYARGKSRSLTINDLVRRVQELYAAGVRETVLTGVHIGDYCDDENPAQPKALEDLVEALLQRTPMPRFRLSSLEPVEVTERLLDLYQDPRMCPHFHMSIQSANTEVLAHMKRKYSQDDVRHALKRIQERVPGAFVGMDVIVGFPTETDDQFEDTYQTLVSLPWTQIHVFPYSERPGTRAEKLESVMTHEQKLRRAARLRELSYARHRDLAEAQVGAVKKILVLKKPAKGAHGLSRDYWPVQIKEADAFLDGWKGQELELKITGFTDQKHNHESVLIADVEGM